MKRTIVLPATPNKTTIKFLEQLSAMLTQFQPAQSYNAENASQSE